MQPLRDLAIVLRVVAYQDRDKIVTALTENHGKISALAKNSVQSRRFGGTLEPFAAAEWLFSEKPGAELFLVQEAHIRRSFEGLRKDFARLSVASAFNELMLRIAPERTPCPDLFKLHSNALVALEEMAIPHDSLPNDANKDLALLNGYLAKLLQWSGNQPQPHFCLECEIALEDVPADELLTTVISVAGWICGKCRRTGTRHIRESHGQGVEASDPSVTPAAIQDFRASLVGSIRQIPALSHASRKEHQALFRFLEALLAFHVQGFDKAPLKSLRFIDVQSNLPRQTESHRQNLRPRL